MVDDLIIEAMNDALDISIRREPIDFAALVADVVASNRPLAERKEQTIVLSGLGSLRLSADQERLREAIDNLLGNAIKYSPTSERIDVTVLLEAGEAVCAFRDRGPGLSPEDTTRLFGRFQRLSAKPTAGESSTGLGLSIVKRIAELHSGRVTATSAGPGLGRPSPSTSRSSRHRMDMNAGQPHIFIVDDEAAAREMVGDYLKMHGFDVTLCDGGVSLRAQ